MSYNRFNLNKRKFHKRNFSDVIEVLIPDIYIQSDIEVSGDVVDPNLTVVNSHLDIADNIINILPLSAGIEFTSLSSFDGIRPFFIKQNNFSRVSPEEFERYILNPLDKSFRDFDDDKEFRSYVEDTLISSIETNNPNQVFTDLGGIDYLTYHLGWFYFLAGSSTYTHQPSSVVTDYFVNYTYKGKPLHLSDGINALTEFVWKNQSSLAAYIPSNFLSGTDTYTSGTQSLEKLKTINSILYSQEFLDRDDTLISDAFDLYDQTQEYQDDRVSNGPFWRLVKAYSYAFADQQDEVNQLSVLYDLQDCPDYLLPELAKLIGWELLGYDPNKWRLQLANAVDIYRKAGTKQSIIAAVNSVFTPGVVNVSGNIQELWESYIPFLIEYALATESIHFKDFTTWTVEKAEQLQVSRYDYNNFNNNIKLAVDKILLTLFEEFPDFFVLAGKPFPRGSDDFTFNYRGRDYPIPPYEEIPYYLSCQISGRFLLRLADLLVCFGVPSSFALKVRNYIDENTISTVDEAYADYSENNGWLFFTLEYQQAPNWEDIVFDPTNKKEEYLPLWNGKSSHYKLNFEANSFDFSKDTFEVDSREVILIANRLADIFSPAHAVKDSSVFLRETDYYTASEYISPELLLDMYDEISASLSSISLGNLETTAINLIGSLPEFNGGRHSFSSIVDTSLSSTDVIIAPRNTLRRRDLHNKLNTGGYYSRTGFNPPIFREQAIIEDSTEESLLSNGYDPTLSLYRIDYPTSALYNPLKGFSPLNTQGAIERSLIPHSVESIKIGMSALYLDGGAIDNTLDFTEFENQLNALSSINCQAAVRIHIDYPTSINQQGQPVNPVLRDYALPLYLRESEGGPVSAQQYLIPATTQSNGTSGYVPDYNNPALLNECIRFIQELGARYDGDVRIAQFDVGLAGHWGAWTNSIASNASRNVLPITFQYTPPISFINALIEEFDSSFNSTPIMGRYLDDSGDRALPYRPTSLTSLQVNVGLHDDSYAWNTLGPRNFYTYPQILHYGIQNKWRRVMQSGEVRPELCNNLDVFNNTFEGSYPVNPQILVECARVLGTTLLAAPIAFSQYRIKLGNGTLRPEQVTNLVFATHRLGYAFSIQSSFYAKTWLKDLDFPIAIGISNNGSAPFYKNWPVKLTLTNGVTSVDVATDYDLRTLMPGQLDYIITTIPASVLQTNFPSGGNINLYVSIEKPANFIRPIIFLNEDLVENSAYMNLGQVNLVDEFTYKAPVFPLGFIPSSLSFASVTTDCSGIISEIPQIYDRCIIKDNPEIYGYFPADTLKTRGYLKINNELQGEYKTYYNDRGQLSPFMAVVHKVADQKIRKKYEQYVEDNPSLFAQDLFWKDVVDSLANEEIYCSGLFLTSLEAYEDFNLGRKIPKLFDLYTSAFNRHPTNYDPYKDFGSNIYAHAFGSVLENSDLENRGSIASQYGLYTTSIDNTKLLDRNSVYFSGSPANLATYETYVASSVSSVIASSTLFPTTRELVNSAIIERVDMIHTSGASELNHFVMYDLQQQEGESFIFNNSFLRMKSINGLPRIRFKVPGSTFGDTYDTFRADNFFCPEHDFRLMIRGLASLEDGSRLIDARLGVWIHTDTENTDQTWHFDKNGNWRLIKTNELTIPKILSELTHEITFMDKSRGDRPSFQCLDPNVLGTPTFLSSIGTFGEDEMQTYELYFNTHNKCHIRVPEEYFKHDEQVHRYDQSYVIEIFMIPGYENRDRFILIEDIDLRDETLFDMTRIDVTGTPTGHRKFPLCNIKHVNLNKEDIRSILNYYNQLAGKGRHIGVMGRDANESQSANFVFGGSRLDYRINPENLLNIKDDDTDHYTLLEVGLSELADTAAALSGYFENAQTVAEAIDTVPLEGEDPEVESLRYGFWFG